MTKTYNNNKLFIMITRTFFDSTVKEQIKNLSQNSIPVFARQPGFISLTLYESHDVSHLMTNLQWDSKTHYEACMATSDFSALYEEWSKLLDSGRKSFELPSYDVISTFQSS